MVFRRLIVILLIFFCSEISYAQEFRLKAYAGTLRYYGDLAPYTLLKPVSDANISFAFSAGIRLNRFLSLNLKYTSGKLSANDANAKQQSSLRRNLRFENPLDELGLLFELDLRNLFFDKKSTYGTNIYLTSGLNLLHVNPRTDYNGEIYFLQPLGTEGQGLAGYEDLYNLTHWNIPYGIGIEVRITDNINAGIEATSRISFTDYLDDVSGEYPDFQLLQSERGEIARLLSDRSGEINSGEYIKIPGDSRGNPDNNDFYIYTGVFITYYFGDNPISIKKLEDEQEDNNVSLIFPSN